MEEHNLFRLVDPAGLTLHPQRAPRPATAEEDDALVQSVERFGVVLPPVCSWEPGSPQLHVVHGARVVRAAQFLRQHGGGCGRIVVRLVPAADGATVVRLAEQLHLGAGAMHREARRHFLAQREELARVGRSAALPTRARLARRPIAMVRTDWLFLLGQFWERTGPDPMVEAVFETLLRGHGMLLPPLVRLCPRPHTFHVLWGHPLIVSLWKLAGGETNEAWRWVPVRVVDCARLEDEFALVEALARSVPWDRAPTGGG